MVGESNKGSANLSMPYYPLFHRDFTLDTIDWPNETIGMLMRLMNYQWDNEFLPSSQKRLAVIVQMQHDPQGWAENWRTYLSQKFTEIEPGKLVNNRLHREYGRICAKNAQAKRAAQIRWGKDRESSESCETDAKPMRPHSKSDASAYAITDNREQTTSISPAARVAVPHQKIVDLYHEHCPALTRVKVINSKRQAALRARWKTFSVEVQGKEVFFNELKTWERYFKFITNNCPFLLGNNDRNWVANFDFCIRETAMVGVFENKYVERK